MTTARLAAVVLAALAACPVAAAHGDGAGRGYTSTVTGVRPVLAGIDVRVLDGDDRLRLVNGSGRELVVLGYDGEPYLRFARDGVFANVRSPATYLNDDRYGNVEVPVQADAKAAPEWKRETRSNSWEWHDHRVHWMSPIDPPRVRADRDREHHVFDWTVPALAGGTRLTIAGSLDYAPPAGRPSWVYPLLFVAAALVIGGIVVALRSGRGRRPSRA